MASRRTRFIWWRGVIWWGLGTGLIYTLLMAFFCREQSTYANEVVRRLYLLPLWGVAGYLFGLVMWGMVGDGSEKQEREGR